MRLTLRTLLAYLDDTLPADQAKAIGLKVAESETAGELIDRIKKVTRRRGLSTPTAGETGGPSDPNTVADYLGDALSSEQIAQFEKTCLESDVHLAEVAACHQILTLLLSEPVRVPPTARQRMYQLVKGRESLPNRKPGNTVPVAGELAESPAAEVDDADAAFLLGMRAYSRSEPWSRRMVPLAAAAALAACLAVAVWLALPASGRKYETADVVPPTTYTLPPQTKPAENPSPPPGGPGGSGGPGAEKAAPQPDAKVAPAPKPVPDKTDKADKTEKPNQKSSPKPPTDLVPAANKPRGDRVAIGKLDNTDAVVVSRTADGKWLRATAKDLSLSSGDRVVCLPGYKGKVTIDPAVKLELWGNLPEQQPVIPVLESAVTLYLPADGFDADLAIHAGRVYVVASRAGGAKIRLRFKDEVWDLTIPDDKTEVAVEVVNSLVRGVTRDIDPSEAPLIQAGVAVTKGTAALKVRFKDLPQIKANEWVTWTSKGPGLMGPNPIDPGRPGEAPPYFSRYELPVGEQAKAAQQALSDLSAKAADRDSIKIALAEMLRDDDTAYTLPRMVGARLAVVSHAAIGDLPPVIDALNDGLRPFVRDAAAYALVALLAATPDGVEQFRKRLADKLSFTEEQSAFAVRLLRGFSEAERRSQPAVDSVLEALSSNTLLIRELAFWTLRTLIDPDLPPTRAQVMFNASGTPEEREPAVKAWRKYFEDLKQKPSPAPKEPEKKK